jgi:hypothetical protein
MPPTLLPGKQVRFEFSVTIAPNLIFQIQVWAGGGTDCVLVADGAEWPGEIPVIAGRIHSYGARAIDHARCREGLSPFPPALDSLA